MPKRLLYGFIIVSVALFLYSYTQIDLNLTLSRATAVQSIQKFFQEIGYFRRDVSVAIYVAIIGFMTLLYVKAIDNAQKGALTEGSFWKLTLLVCAILLFSYPAFSYDIYNYMFTAKTVLVYHQNPYLVIPLDFKGVEPWLSFMRWTHLPSAYTPLWILVSLPAYILGFGTFLFTLWSMKLLMLGCYLATVLMIGKLLMLFDPKKKVLGMVIFALNPLIIIESIVSSHNDIVMMALAMGAWVLFVERKRLSSWIVLSTSVALKFMTICLIPVALLGWNRKLALAAMVAGLLIVVSQREVLPWYWVWIMPFVALLPRSRTILTISIGVSVGLLLRYTPYLYQGNWDPPAHTVQFWLTLVPIFFSVLLTVRKNKV